MPAVKRHDGRLANTEHVERQEHRGGKCLRLIEDATGTKIHRPGDIPGTDNGEQQKEYRGGQQDSQVDPTAQLGLLGSRMGDQRIGREGEHLIKDEQGEKVASIGYAHHRRDGDGKTDIESGLIGLLVTPHVADGVQSGDQPQEAGNQREQHPQRLNAEI